MLEQEIKHVSSKKYLIGEKIKHCFRQQKYQVGARNQKLFLATKISTTVRARNQRMYPATKIALKFLVKIEKWYFKIFKNINNAYGWYTMNSV